MRWSRGLAYRYRQTDRAGVVSDAAIQYNQLMMIDRISADRQIVLPSAVLEALGLGPGDPIAFVIDGLGEVILGRVDDPFINLFVTFTEWDSDADREAYRDL